MICRPDCLSHRQGETRIPESSEVGSNQQMDGWIRGAVRFAVLDIQDGGSENIQEAGNRCLTSPSRTRESKGQPQSIAIYNRHEAGNPWCHDTAWYPCARRTTNNCIWTCIWLIHQIHYLSQPCSNLNRSRLHSFRLSNDHKRQDM